MPASPTPDPPMPRRVRGGMHVDAVLSLDEQTANLRLMGESRALPWLFPIALVVAALGFGAFAWFDDETSKVFALFVASVGTLVALAAGLSGPHLRNAARATHGGVRRRATLVLQPHLDTDEDARAWRATLRPLDAPRDGWDLYLSSGSGWTAQPGGIEVDAVYLDGIAWPVLLVADAGLLWPRSTPRRAGHA